LGEGFEVVEGTSLVGDPIPIGVEVVVNGEPVVDRGWAATLLVEEGDPTQITREYMRQAAAVGLVEQPGSGCVRDLDVTLCSAFARSADRNVPRSLSATVVRGSRGDVLSNHVVVRYSTENLYWEHGREITAGDPKSSVPAAAPWPPLPGVGEPIGSADEMSFAVVVQRGSRLAGPARLNLDDATGGVSAVFEVTDDPKAVLDAYLRHLRGFGLDTSRPETRAIGDTTLTTAYASESGGDSYELKLVERPGRPAWLAIDGSHD
jgi:hypothetical protein